MNRGMRASYGRSSEWWTSINVKGLTLEFVFFVISTLAYQTSRLAVTLTVAGWVGPQRFGIWNALNLLLLYGALVTLGVPNGMNRNIPLLMGKGERFRAEQVANSSFWFVLFSSLAGGLLIVAAGVLGQVARGYRQTLVSMGLLFVAWQIYQYAQFRIKSHINFRRMSIQQVIFAIFLPIVTLPMAWIWELPGFIVGQAIAAIGISVFILWNDPYKITLSWNWRYLFPLIRVGLPIMAAGLLYSLLTSVDRWVILHFLGVEALGHYTLAIMSVGVLSMLPTVISQQMYPRMAFKYGQTQNKRSLLPMILWQSLAGTAVTLPILVLIGLFLPFVVNRFLPAYTPGVAPTRILLVGLFFLSFAGGMGNFLNTVGKQVSYLAVQAGTVLVNLGLDVLLVKKGLGLCGVAWGASLSYALYAVALVLIGVWVIKQRT